MGQSPSVPVMEQSPWVHEMEQSAWDHEMGQSPWVSEIDQSPWVPEMDQSPWVTEMEQSPRVHEMEQSHWVHKMEQSPWIPGMEQSPWVLEMGQTPLHFQWCPHLVPPEWCPHLVPPEVAQPKPMLKLDDDDDDEGPQGRLHHEGGFKVPHRVRQVNEAAYEPELISIGPCYRNKEHLRYMEEIKNKFFREFFSQKEEIKNRCFKVMRRMEGKARKWYEASVVDSIDSNFVEMMVVDGCFIIELLCNEPKDPIATTRWSRLALFLDLLLLENQLPFFVLVKLYGLIKDPMDKTEFAHKAFNKLIQVLRLPISRIGTENPSTIKDTNKIDHHHLLGLLHDNWLPSPKVIDHHKKYIKNRSIKKVERERKSIRCAIELEEAGIKFIKVRRKKGRSAFSLFDVNFTNGKMKIPKFVINNNTERLFRNLIAYELFVQGSTYVIDYMTLMDNLVNTADDVKLLRLSGVIQNMQGNDEDVAKMLNKLLDNVTSCGNTFFYEEIFVGLKKHCANPWNTWKEKYTSFIFSKTWTRIAFAAGLLSIPIGIITFIYSFFKKN